MLNERSDIPGIETIETKDRLAIIQGQKVVESTVETMDRLAISQGLKIVETTGGFSRKRKVWKYG